MIPIIRNGKRWKTQKKKLRISKLKKMKQDKNSNQLKIGKETEVEIIKEINNHSMRIDLETKWKICKMSKQMTDGKVLKSQKKNQKL